MSATSAIVIVLVLSLITLGVLTAVAASSKTSSNTKKKVSPTPSTGHRSNDDNSCANGLDSAKSVYEEALDNTSDQLSFMKKNSMDISSVTQPTNKCMFIDGGSCASEFTYCTNELDTYLDKLNDILKGNMIVPKVSTAVTSMFKETLQKVKDEEKQMLSVGLYPEQTPKYSTDLLQMCDNGIPKTESSYVDCTKMLGSYLQRMKTVVPPSYPSGLSSEFDMQKWSWSPYCKSAPKFVVKTAWPTFLSNKAWDNGCQGCKSIPALNKATPDCQQNNSRDSFQIAGQWMRISQRNAGSFSNVSTGSSKEHWFNPPRDKEQLKPGEKPDDPLEVEWYMHLDASDIGKTIDELVETKFANANWSAFWAFGHGKVIDPENNFGWPYSGEWDLAESLPAFSNWDDTQDTTVQGRGVASGFHNGSSGAFPPCCLKRDGVMYPLPTKEDFIDIAAFPAAIGSLSKEKTKAIKEGTLNDFLIEKNDELYYFPSVIEGQPNAIPFLSWGEALFLQKNGREPRNDREQKEAAVMSFNKNIHCILRVTTKAAALWILYDADPTVDLDINVNSSMSQEEYGGALLKAGFIQVFSSYGDFGSNNDTSFSSQFGTDLGQVGFPKGKGWPYKGTNWHQNMFFVWSVVTQMNNSSRYVNVEGTAQQKEFWRHLTSYMSDISIRGGGNHTKALRPNGMQADLATELATEALDPTAKQQYTSLGLNHYQCSGHDITPAPYSSEKCVNILTGTLSPTPGS